MRKLQAIKGSIGVFALMFAASLLLLLPGCQGPLGPRDSEQPATGTVQLTLEMPPVGRAILPTVTLADFHSFNLAFTPTAGGTAQNFPVPGVAEGAAYVTASATLPVDTSWNLVVTAYLTEGGAAVLSGSPTAPVNVVATGITVAPIALSPIPSTEPGTFSWDITFEGAPYAATLTVRSFDNIHNVLHTVNLLDDPDSYMPLDVGSYNVLVRVVNGGQIASLGMALHILPYFQMPSHLEHRFAANHFRPPFTGRLYDFINLTGILDGDDFAWYEDNITEGEIFTALGPLARSESARLEWVEYGDGGLILRVFDRYPNAWAGLDLLNSFGFQANDIVTFHARIPPLADWGGLVLNLNTGAGYNVERGQIQANAGGIVNVSTGDLSVADVQAIENGTGIRLQGQGSANNVDIFVHGITIYRPDPYFVPSTLGDFITLVDMPDQGWQNRDIRAGAVYVGDGQPLLASGGPILAWIDVDDEIALSMTGRANGWDGLDLRIGELGFTADGVYQMTVTGTGALELSRNPHDAAGWAVTGTATGPATDLTLVTSRFTQANLGAATAIRIQGPANTDIVITNVTFERVGVICPGCQRPDDECICGVDGYFTRLPGSPGNLDDLRDTTDAEDIAFDMQDFADTDAAVAHFGEVGGTSNRGTVFAYEIDSHGLIALVTNFTGSGANDPLGNDWAPLSFLLADQDGIGVGYTIHIVGRFGFPSDPPSPAFEGGAARGLRRGFTGASIVGENLSFATGPFTIVHTLSADDIEAGLSIGWNGWGTFGPALVAGTSGFTISVDDLVIIRAPEGQCDECLQDPCVCGPCGYFPCRCYQIISFNLEAHAPFQNLIPQTIYSTGWRAEIGDARLNIEGGGTDANPVPVTIHEQGGRRFMHVGPRVSGWHGVNVMGVPEGSYIRVTGRLSGDWTGQTGSIQFTDGGTGGYLITNALANDGMFTLTGSNYGGSFRVGTGSAGPGGVPGPFYIYSIIVGRNFGQPPATGVGNDINISVVENFWPPVTTLPPFPEGPDAPVVGGAVVWTMASWLADNANASPTNTTRPLQANFGTDANFAVANGGINITSRDQGHQGLDIHIGPAYLNLNPAQNIYRVHVGGRVIGTPPAAAQIALQGSGGVWISDSPNITGENGTFAFMGELAAGFTQNIRIQSGPWAEGGPHPHESMPFRVTYIVIERVGPRTIMDYVTINIDFETLNNPLSQIEGGAMAVGASINPALPSGFTVVGWYFNAARIHGGPTLPVSLFHSGVAGRRYLVTLRATRDSSATVYSQILAITVNP